MITEVPFSITQADVKFTPHFLVENEGTELNPDPNIVKIIGQFTAKSNTNSIRRRYESKTFTSEEVTDKLISSYKKEWTENFRKYCKESL